MQRVQIACFFILLCLGIQTSAQIQQALAGSAFKEEDQAFTGVVNTIQGGHFSQRMESYPISPEACIGQLREYLQLSPGHNFQSFRVVEDDLGIRHESLQEYYQGIKVLHHMVLVHSRQNLVTVMNGDVVSLDTLTIQPQLSPEAAYAIARNTLGLKSDSRHLPQSY